MEGKEETYVKKSNSLKTKTLFSFETILEEAIKKLCKQWKNLISGVSHFFLQKKAKFLREKHLMPLKMN